MIFSPADPQLADSEGHLKVGKVICMYLHRSSSQQPAACAGVKCSRSPGLISITRAIVPSTTDTQPLIREIGVNSQ